MTAAQAVQQQERSLDSYLILPESPKRGQEYPDLLVSQNKSHFNKRWYKAHELLADENSLMLSPRQFFDFIDLLKSRRRVYDGNGTKIDSGRINAILDDILTVSFPYRAEWLDAYFIKREGKLYIQSGHIKLADERLVPMSSEPLEECLMEDYYIGLKSINRQGLPTKIAKDESICDRSIYYFHPREGMVARFWVYSGGAFLGCNRDARGSNVGLGVRPSKIFHDK